MSAYAVVPVKTLLKSKMRLSGFFTPEERALFTLAMLEDVLKALRDSKIEETVVVGSDGNVKDLVGGFGVTFLAEKQEGLNEALNQATEWCLRKKAGLVLALPADVPLVTPEDIDVVVRQAAGNSIVVSPSHNGGTNALLRTPPEAIEPCFGHESFKKHVAAASVRGVKTKFYASANIMLDIDSEADLQQLLRSGRETASRRFLQSSSRSSRA